MSVSAGMDLAGYEDNEADKQPIVFCFHHAKQGKETGWEAGR
jgi:hypothetical protein